MKQLSDIEKQDFQRFYKDTDEKGFSPTKNKYIIEKTIRDYEAKRAQNMKSKVELYAERADAVISYLKHLEQGKGESNLMRYFGKRELARLRGDEIREKLMHGLQIVRAQKGQ